MMTSTRETRKRALEEEEGDDDNDNKLVGFLATKKQWLLLMNYKDFHPCP